MSDNWINGNWVRKMVKKEKCIMGQPVKKDVFTYMRPFRDSSCGISGVFGSGNNYQTIDGKKQFRITGDERGRGNININICENKVKKKFGSTTSSYGCDKNIFNKTMKRRNAEEKVRDFVKEKNLMCLPVSGFNDEKDVFDTIYDESQKSHFKQKTHCAKKLGKNYDKNTKEFDKVKKKLKDEWHYATWGDADQNVPEANIKKGKDAIELMTYDKNGKNRSNRQMV